MYDTVLVPTDGSELSLLAAEEALDLTTPTGTIHALAVPEELPFEEETGAETEPSAEQTAQLDLLEGATEQVEDIVTEHDRDCVTAIRPGVPFQEITAYAEAIDADAIVMSKRGQGAAEHDVLGSTTERVISGSPAPVLVIPVMANLRRYRSES